MKRKTHESFEDFIIRRRNDKEMIKEQLESKMVWNSLVLGTYKRHEK